MVKYYSTYYQYECDNCGACCIHLHPAITIDDRRREPSVEARVRQMYPLGLLREMETEWYLADSADSGCPFHQIDGLCAIHAAKPDVCRRFIAGSELCQYARGRAGLSTLKPTSSNTVW